jgi:hypothetical protein
MQLPFDTFIAGRKTVADWLAIRIDLNNFAAVDLWESTFTDFFLTRLRERYLNPIDAVKNDGTYSGEGFSIMTILCSLIEFIESTYQGTNYKYRGRNAPPLQPNEYSFSGEIFQNFLIGHEPFRSRFNAALADSFYSNVRCGLLHEARTSGRWTIWGRSFDGQQIVEDKGGSLIVFRDDFYDAIKTFVEVDYKNEVLNSSNRKEAFLRKFDRLCLE